MNDLDGLDLLRFLWVDNANIIRSKSVPLHGHAVPRLDRAVRISQALYALPVYADAVVEQTGLLPTHDVTLVPDWSTLRRLGASGVVSCDIYDGDQPWVHCPRSFLRRMDDRARAAGMTVNVGTEFEFTLLRDGAPIDNTAFAQDSAFDLDVAVIGDLLTTLHAQGLPVAQCHPESGPGQWEISLKPLHVLSAADAIVGVRQTVRAVAAWHQMTVSFLPMVTEDGVGAGMHTHVSFTGDPADGFGEFGRPFMAGVLRSLPALLAATAPSPLSLLRFRPRYWAGAFLGWGEDNKEAPLRVIFTDARNPRDVEYKASDASANPYILLGCLLAAGLDGLESGAELPAPMVGDPGLLSQAERDERGIEAMPTHPEEVLAAFEQSALFADAMGPLHMSYCAVHAAELAYMRGMDFDELVEVSIDRV